MLPAPCQGTQQERGLCEMPAETRPLEKRRGIGAGACTGACVARVGLWRFRVAQPPVTISDLCLCCRRSTAYATLPTESISRTVMKRDGVMRCGTAKGHGRVARLQRYLSSGPARDQVMLPYILVLELFA